MLLQGPDEEDVDPDPVDPDAVEAHALSSVNLGGLSSNGSQFYSLETSSLQEERLKFLSNSFVLRAQFLAYFFHLSLPSLPGKETEVKKRPKESLR